MPLYSVVLFDWLALKHSLHIPHAPIFDSNLVHSFCPFSDSPWLLFSDLAFILWINFWNVFEVQFYLDWNLFECLLPFSCHIIPLSHRCFYSTGKYSIKYKFYGYCVRVLFFLLFSYRHSGAVVILPKRKAMKNVIQQSKKDFYFFLSNSKIACGRKNILNILRWKRDARDEHGMRLTTDGKKWQ